MTSRPFMLSAFTMSTASHGNFGMWRHPGRPHVARTPTCATGWSWRGCSTRADSTRCSSPTRSANSTCSVATRSPHWPVGCRHRSPIRCSRCRRWPRPPSGSVSVSPCRPPMRARTCWHASSARWTTSPAAGSAGTSSRRCWTAPPATSSAVTGRSHTTSATRWPQEFVEVTYKLWEGSWEDDAVVRDRDRGVYTDPAKVHPIGHEGRYFSVPGAHLVEPSPQRTPVLFQAGHVDGGPRVRRPQRRTGLRQRSAARRAARQHRRHPAPRGGPRPRARLDQVPHLRRDRRRQHRFGRPRPRPQNSRRTTTSRADSCCCRR